jgi:hypothetical protein
VDGLIISQMPLLTTLVFARGKKEVSERPSRRPYVLGKVIQLDRLSNQTAAIGMRRMANAEVDAVVDDELQTVGSGWEAKDNKQ